MMSDLCRRYNKEVEKKHNRMFLAECSSCRSFHTFDEWDDATIRKIGKSITTMYQAMEQIGAMNAEHMIRSFHICPSCSQATTFPGSAGGTGEILNELPF